VVLEFFAAVEFFSHNFSWNPQNKNLPFLSMYFFLIQLLVGRVQLGPLGTSATNWPLLPAPGDYENGEFGEMMMK
jgi:hypothetical protein